MKNNLYYTGRGYVYNLQYHIIWCVKYRHKIINENISKQLKDIITTISEKYDFKIISMETDKDHIHLLLDCSPQLSIPKLIKILKGTTGRKILYNNPDIKEKLYGGHLWSPSYFITTSSDNTNEQIKHYIESQGKKK